MAQVEQPGGHVTGLGATWRRDAWWVGPLVTGGAFFGWIVYYTWAALQSGWYAAGPYLSPFYAPLFFVDPAAPGAAHVEHAFFGTFPAGWPSWIPASPALLILPFPAAFRLTCYYYRKFYYRAYFLSPPGCGVGPVQAGRYKGETGLLIFQNLHRYALYFALALLPFLFLEAGRAFFHEGRVGFGIGTFMLLGNAILLSGYTLGCHAWRHLIGGRVDCFSCDGGTRTAHGAWTWTTWLNERHMQFAWASLIWILLADLYVRLVSMGVIPDVNTWNGVTWITEF